jgi:signal transduction histidine kinase
LHAILSAIQVLKNKSHLPSELDPIVSIIERNAKTEARLVQDLLDLSKFSAGKMLLNCERLTLRPVLEAVLECMRPICDEKRLTLYLAHTGPSRVLWIDPQRIEQIAMNLLSNAAKFTDSGGWIEVNLDEGSPSEVVLSVSDSGIGIEKELEKDLFRPFTQGDTPHRNAGIGLGLAIVKGLVELHGGTIEARSGGRGKGSTFVIRLPISSSSRNFG